MFHAKELQQRKLVRLVVLSDTHNRHKAINKLLPPADENNIPSILLHCGDFADRGSLQHVRSFCRWLSRNDLPSHFHHVVVVDGNHDRARHPAPEIDLTREFAKCNQKLQEHGIQRRVHFLQDSSVRIHGLAFYGVSWKSIENEDYSDLFQEASSSVQPDVVLSHLIPYFTEKERKVAIGLDTKDIDFRKWRGSRTLTAIAIQCRLPLVCSGHVHWGRGAVLIPHANNPTGSWFVNAANTKPGYNTYNGGQSAEEEVTPPTFIYYDTQSRCVVHLACPPHEKEKSRNVKT